jgi:hypothetical protein
MKEITFVDQTHFNAILGTCKNEKHEVVPAGQAISGTYSTFFLAPIPDDPDPGTQLELDVDKGFYLYFAAWNFKHQTSIEIEGIQYTLAQ